MSLISSMAPLFGGVTLLAAHTQIKVDNNEYTGLKLYVDGKDINVFIPDEVIENREEMEIVKMVYSKLNES